jgi:hypothetical protein
MVGDIVVRIDTVGDCRSAVAKDRITGKVRDDAETLLDFVFGDMNVECHRYIVYIDNYIWYYIYARMFRLNKLHTSSIPTNIEDDDLVTPKAPRGKRSDLTEKDLEEFVRSFSSVMMAGHLE